MKRVWIAVPFLLGATSPSRGDELTENPIPPPPQVDAPQKPSPPRRAKGTPAPRSTPTARPASRPAATPPPIHAVHEPAPAEAPVIVDEAAGEPPSLEAGSGWVWFLGAFAILAVVIFLLT